MKRTQPGLAALILLCASALPATDWPHARGPGFDGHGASEALSAGELALELAWRIPLGSGYSGIAIADGRAVTLYSDGDADWAGAFDLRSGERLWRYRLGDRYEGHDGSDDGPLSSPSIDDGRVIALTPRGLLVALALGDGSEIWKRDLTAELGAVKPDFGFTSSPALVDGVLVVQAGGANGRAIVGLDPATGATRWSHSDDTVIYQTPIAMRLAGRAQVVAVSRQTIVGVAASDGEVLWRHTLGEGDRANSAVPTFIGDDRFLVAMGGGVTAYRVAASDDGFAVEELYRSNALGRKYAPPVYREGHVYGFRGNILTCMKADDGTRVWRSRPPGGESLVLVGDRLVIFAGGGDIVIADASPEGFVERARVPALDGASLTWPSFAADRVLVRNLEEMAAVAVTRGRHGSDRESSAAQGTFDRWLERVAAAGDKAAEVERLLASSPNGPLVDRDRVHFLYRGNAEDVAIAGSMLGGTVEPMTRVPGTDLFYRTFTLEPGLRWEYRFQLDFEGWLTDPRNPRTVPDQGRGEWSELVPDGYRTAAHLAEPASARGTVETFTLASKALESDKEVTVWLPPGHGEADRRYPVLIVNEGPAWRDKGLLINSLDNLVGKAVSPVIVAFVEPAGAWWEEAGGSKIEAYVRMQADELLPALVARYNVAEGPGHATLGLRYYGASALYAALRRPDVFGRAAMLSPHVGLGVDQEVARRIRQGDAKGARLYLDWNRFDERRVDRGIDFGDAARALDRDLRAAGYAISGGEVADSAGWGAWRSRNDRFLRALFPLD